MHITINRAELLAAVKRASTIAPPDSPLDVLKGVLLEADSADGMLTVTSTNLEVSLAEKLPCTVHEDGALVFTAKTLAEMLQRLPEETAELCRRENRGRMTLTSGSAGYSVDVWDMGAFPKPDLPFPEDTVKVSGVPSILATPSRKTAAMYPPMRENPAQGSARRPAALHRTSAMRMADCHSKKNGEGGQAALPPAHTHTKENKICQTVLSVRNL